MASEPGVDYDVADVEDRCRGYHLRTSPPHHSMLRYPRRCVPRYAGSLSLHKDCRIDARPAPNSIADILTSSGATPGSGERLFQRISTSDDVEAEAALFGAANGYNTDQAVAAVRL